MSVTLLQGDCRTVLPTLEANSVDAIVTDPPYGLEFMGKDWDKLGGWQAGGGFSKPGIGARPTEWSSFSSTSRFGAANPTCAKCGGRLRGKKPCTCEQPHEHWKPIGKRRNPENEGLPDDMTGGGMARQMSAMQDWHYAWAVEALRVAKPGAHLLAFGGTRTHHRLMCALEDAGWEIRDCVMWVYGSGFPKSLDVSKAIDKAAGAEREVVERRRVRGGGMEHVNRTNADTHGYRPDGYQKGENVLDVTAPATDAAQQWQGWGTALKPAWEPIILARKPLSERTVAANGLRWGTGALNIDGCRIEFSGTADELESKTKNQHADFGSGPMTNEVFGTFTKDRDYNPPGRWPANVVLSHGDECELIGMKQVNGNGHHPTARGQGGLGTSGHSGQDDLVERTARGESVEDWQCAPDCPVRMLDEQGGDLQPAKGAYVRKHGATQFLGALGDGRSDPANGVSDKGGPSRFFYTAKASRSEREIGLYGASRAHGMSGGAQNNLETGYDKAQSIGLNRVVQVRNHHPTVKPIDLMRWLVRMVTPKGGTVLDCFAGSGSTGIAADREGFSAILIEQNAEYAEIAKRRIEGDAPLFAQVQKGHP